MAASKPEVHISHPTDWRETQLQTPQQEGFRSRRCHGDVRDVGCHWFDCAALNTLVLWLFKNPGWCVKKRGQRRKHFLHELGMALVMPQIERRETLAGLQSDIRSAINTILDHPSALPPQSDAAASVAKCTTCIRESYGKGYKKAKYSANKVKQRCIKCQRPTCKKHSTTSVVCESCTS